MNQADLIEKWFDEHADEGDFSRGGPIYPYTIIGPVTKQATVVYLTKSNLLHYSAEDLADSINFGIVARTGLPNNFDVDWLRDLIGGRELLFIGDLDPADLLVYVWLRERFQPAAVRHTGINDQFIARLGVVVPDNFRITLGPVEKAAVAIFEDLFPDARKVLGEKCFDLLHCGYKIELEAVVSALGKAAPLLQTAADQ